VRDLRVTLGGDTIYPNASPESLGLYDMIEIEAAWWLDALPSPM